MWGEQCARRFCGCGDLCSSFAASAVQSLPSLVPLSKGETAAVFARVTDTRYATVYGTLAVAVVQGCMGSLMFWMLGLPAALL